MRKQRNGGIWRRLGEREKEENLIKNGNVLSFSVKKERFDKRIKFVGDKIKITQTIRSNSEKSSEDFYTNIDDIYLNTNVNSLNSLFKTLEMTALSTPIIDAEEVIELFK